MKELNETVMDRGSALRGSEMKCLWEVKNCCSRLTNRLKVNVDSKERGVDNGGKTQVE